MGNRNNVDPPLLNPDSNFPHYQTHQKASWLFWGGGGIGFGNFKIKDRSCDIAFYRYLSPHQITRLCSLVERQLVLKGTNNIQFLKIECNSSFLPIFQNTYLKIIMYICCKWMKVNFVKLKFVIFWTVEKWWEENKHLAFCSCVFQNKSTLQ